MRSLCFFACFGLSTVASLAAEPPAAPTYSRDVAPILARRCQGCHRPGEVAPMPLLSYAEVRPYAESIKEEVEARRMPPWHADPKHGRFSNDATLPAEELKTILTWIETGAAEGDPAHLPAPQKWVEGWNIGKPDIVFTMAEEHSVPARGEVPYQYFVVPTGFAEDRWLQAAEVRPGNRAVVHHILVFYVEKGQRFRERSGNLFNYLLAGTAPGEEPTVFPEGTAKKIPAECSLVFQVHYTPNGKAGTDRSSIGFRFAKAPVKKEVVSRAAMNQLFLIPPGATDHQVVSQYRFSRDSEIVSLMPHMHLRGKSFEYKAIFPDGTEKILLSVPRWDFNWQHVYRLAAPMLMPKGATIVCRAVYDNSTENKANPDPAKTVHWGDQTWEEMMIGFIDFVREPVAKSGAGSEKAGSEKAAPGKPAAKAKEPSRV